MVPLRYLRTYLACARWPSEGLEQYLASMLVIGAMSGRVEVVSHVSDPRIDWKVLVRCAWCASEYVWDLILSTGRPDLNGAVGVRI